MPGVGEDMERLAVVALLGLVRILAILPLRTQRFLGRSVGRLVLTLRPEALRIAKINLARCFPETSPRARERIARSSIQETAQLFAEAGILIHWPPARWMRLAVDVVGESLIQDALNRCQSVLVLVPHLGNWEYLSLYLGKYRITALYDPPRVRALDQPIRQARSRTGARLEPISRSGLRAVYKTLTGGGVAVVLPDQVPERSAGVYVDFFGTRALTMTLASRLIARTQPRVIVGAALRAPGGFVLRFVEADQSVRAEDPSVSAAAINRSIERLILDAPAQYQWGYKRFKRPPPGEADCYQ